LYTEQGLEPDSDITLEADAGHYLTRVLKLRQGQSLVLFNGDGSDYAADLVSLQRERVQVRVNARLPAASESPLDLCLVQAISRGERMDQSLQKATELGARRLQPLFTERVEVRVEGERLDKRMVHWLGVVRAACAQSGRATVPALEAPIELDDWLRIPARGLRFVLAPVAERSISSLDPLTGLVELLVGPEGGFSDEELVRCEQSGVIALSMGSRILRTETAGPAAIAVLQAMHGDF